MHMGRLSILSLISSLLVVCGSLGAEEASTPDGASVLVIERDEFDVESKQSQYSGDKTGASPVSGKMERPDRNTASGRPEGAFGNDPESERPYRDTASRRQKGVFENAPDEVMVKFEYSGCVLRDPTAARAYSEREIYSILLALSDSGAKAAQPFAESKDNIDKGARQAAETMIALQKEENTRIREIMLKERMDYDPGVNGFANHVTAGISPSRHEGAIGRNIFPFAARYHAIVIALALEALEFSDDEEARELAYDLIVDHSEALTEVKELQQAK